MDTGKKKEEEKVEEKWLKGYGRRTRDERVEKDLLDPESLDPESD